ncbi:DUF3870 domain-containing protein [Oceanobacillus timonensis]|uniref:DUF3870 domain-containing protein n=1 Tax=Oceanobacillus timonensis TaxID=1926285 RepID=UPI0009B9F71A|nr:DUF3870 domain-containing protein [Oceanobacillus timonensis]
MYEDHMVYIIGDAKAPSNNPITKQYNGFFIGLVINKETHEIVDFDCSATIELTVRFLRSLFIKEKMIDTSTIINKIESRYFGSSQKGIIVAYKDALKKYKQIISDTASLH